MAGLVNPKFDFDGYLSYSQCAAVASVAYICNVCHSGRGGEVGTMASKRTIVNHNKELQDQINRRKIYIAIIESVKHFTSRYKSAFKVSSIKFYHNGDFILAVAKFANDDVININVSASQKTDKLTIDLAVMDAIREHKLGLTTENSLLCYTFEHEEKMYYV